MITSGLKKIMEAWMKLMPAGWISSSLLLMMRTKVLLNATSHANLTKELEMKPTMQAWLQLMPEPMPVEEIEMCKLLRDKQCWTS